MLYEVKRRHKLPINHPKFRLQLSNRWPDCFVFLIQYWHFPFQHFHLHITDGRGIRTWDPDVGSGRGIRTRDPDEGSRHIRQIDLDEFSSILKSVMDGLIKMTRAVRHTYSWTQWWCATFQPPGLGFYLLRTAHKPDIDIAIPHQTR